jgi:hypothetical protein
VESKRVVIDGAPFDLTDTNNAAGRQTIDYVLNISEKLQLNELQCVQLVWAAAQQVNKKQRSIILFIIIKFLFFWKTFIQILFLIC